VIDLKWLKKIVNWLKSNEEYYIEEIILEADEEFDIEKLTKKRKATVKEPMTTFQNERNPEEENQRTNRNEIDTQINYQYPKGEFRFPIMVDPPNRQQKPVSRSTNTVREFNEKRVGVRPVSVEPQKRTDFRQTDQKKAFKPTPIPSPVFGYHERPKKNEGNSFVFDLDESTKQDKPAVFRKREESQQKKLHVNGNIESTIEEKNNAISSVKSASTENEVKQELTKEMSSVDIPVFFRKKEEEIIQFDERVTIDKEDIEVAPAKEVELGLITDSYEIKNEADEVSIQSAPQSLEEIAVTIEKKAIEESIPTAHEGTKIEESTPAAHERMTIEESTPVAHERTVIEESTPVAYERTVIEESTPVAHERTAIEESTPAVHERMTIEESTPTVHERTAIEESTPAAHERMAIEESTPAVHERTAIEESTPVEQEEKVIEELISVEQEKEIEEVTPVETIAAERPVNKAKTIPFNVVMLRQDREKWMKNKQSLAITKEPEPLVSQNVVIDEGTMNEEPHQTLDEEPYYHFPTIEYLTPPLLGQQDDEWIEQQGRILNETLFNFNVRANVVNITQGPAVTQFEIQPEPGVKVNKITNLADDIKLCLAAQDIRMEAPIPGKHTIGIEIPNRKSRPVFLREILESPAFQENDSPLTVALGLDITGSPIVTDLRKMPHGLIAGATGSGKSVCINTMLISLLYKANPQDVKLLLIDPKMVELAPYNNIPHLVSPVITDVKAATAALKWAVDEMERRYELFAHTGVRDIGRFNSKAKEAGQHADRLPYIIVVIDELADLMMMSPAEVEESICRIAQKARACGIHLLVATQRPSVDVITGLIKANIPTRIAFSVSSQVDSRTIIDSIGADKLLGKGDMLFLENGSSKTVRLQGTFVSDEEIEKVVAFVQKEQEPQYLFEQEDLLAKAQVLDERDELFVEACEFVIEQNGASTSSLQRKFHIGYNRAARLIEMLESSGIISEARGSKPREVLMSYETLQEWLNDDAD